MINEEDKKEESDGGEYTHPQTSDVVSEGVINQPSDDNIDKETIADIHETLKEVTSVLKQVNKEKEVLANKNQELEKRINELEKLEPKALHDSEKSVVEGFYDTFGHSMELVNESSKKDYESAVKQIERLNSIFSL